MAQVDIYQYSEVIKSDGTKIKIGSKQKPSTITLNGTGQVIHRLYNDIAATTAQVLMNDEFVSEWPLWWAVKSSTAGTIAWGNDSSNSQCIGLTADVWQFFQSGRATTYNDDVVATRAAASLSAVGDIVYYNRAATAADVEFIAVC